MTGCASSAVSYGPKKEVVSYLSKTIAAEDPVNLYLTCDFSNVEIYSWDKREVRFDISKRVRGIEDKDTLKEKLNDFNIDMGSDKDRIFLNSRYRGSIKSPADKSADLKVYIPRKTSSIHCRLDLGTIKILDNIKCSLNADVDMVNTEISNFEGKLHYKANMGNLKIGGGKFENGSNIELDQGNIIVKSELESGGKYKMETGIGNVDLMIPADSEVSIENMGPVEINEFKDAAYPGKILLSTKMGKISIKKFK
jgi:hypothetical protein